MLADKKTDFIKKAEKQGFKAKHLNYDRDIVNIVPKDWIKSSSQNIPIEAKC